VRRGCSAEVTGHRLQFSAGPRRAAAIIQQAHLLRVLVSSLGMGSGWHTRHEALDLRPEPHEPFGKG
jgi:hypothetical protein